MRVILQYMNLEKCIYLLSSRETDCSVSLCKAIQWLLPSSLNVSFQQHSAPKRKHQHHMFSIFNGTHRYAYTHRDDCQNEESLLHYVTHLPFFLWLHGTTKCFLPGRAPFCSNRGKGLLVQQNGGSKLSATKRWKHLQMHACVCVCRVGAGKGWEVMRANNIR